MSKSGKQKPGKPEKELTPITVYVTSAVLGLAGYLAGEFGLGNWMHPVHWVSGLAGIALGYWLGKLIYRRFGDIFGF